MTTEDDDIGKLIEFSYAMPIYRKTGGKGSRLIGEALVEMQARVDAWDNGNRFARAERVEGWAWSTGNSTRKREFTQAFMTANGIRLWGLERVLKFRALPILEPPVSIHAVSKVDAERLRYLPLDRSLSRTPHYRTEPCPRCGGRVHVDYDRHGEVLVCMKCGGLN